ncbi:MAG: hypothetical protein K2Q10_12225, partial [Rhodospirillales bacterium]|nr:hypothetical protein [Rhodospirillales bacterium]
KNLAMQTAKATEDITHQIATIRATARQAVEDIRAIGEVISEMNDIANVVSQAMDQQDTSARAIATKIESASQAAYEVSELLSQLIGTVAATREGAENIRASSDDLSDMADMLNNSLSRLVDHLEVEESDRTEAGDATNLMAMIDT